MNNYDKIDVLKVFNKHSPLSLFELISYFPNPNRDYNHLNECFKLLRNDEYIQPNNPEPIIRNGELTGEVRITSTTRWEISPNGIKELERLDSQKVNSDKLTKLQIESLEKGIVDLKRKLRFYYIFLIITVFSGIVSLTTIYKFFHSFFR